MKLEITTIFNDFISRQLDINAIAAACKQCKLDDYMKVLVAIAAYFCNGEPPKEGILLEFEKALAYKICVINGTLNKAR